MISVGCFPACLSMHRKYIMWDALLLIYSIWSCHVSLLFISPWQRVCSIAHFTFINFKMRQCEFFPSNVYYNFFGFICVCAHVGFVVAWSVATLISPSTSMYSQTSKHCGIIYIFGHITICSEVSDMDGEGNRSQNSNIYSKLNFGHFVFEWNIIYLHFLKFNDNLFSYNQSLTIENSSFAIYLVGFNFITILKNIQGSNKRTFWPSIKYTHVLLSTNMLPFFMHKLWSWSVGMLKPCNYSKRTFRKEFLML